LAEAARKAGRLYKLGRFIVCGVVLITLGVLTVAEPELRDDAASISTGDVARGAVLGVAGVAVGMIGWWLDQNARRATRSKAAPSGLATRASSAPSVAPMDDRLLRFASLLFRDNPAAMATMRDAAAQRAAFIAQHASDLGYVRPKPGWAPGPWSLLLDVAQVSGWVRIVDCREASNEVAASVAAVRPAAAIPVDWKGLAAAHVETETREFLRLLAQAMPAGERLVRLDDGSDSYPLALLPSASLAEAEQLAADLCGRVDALDAETNS
jgi:hypothetical protein